MKQTFSVFINFIVKNRLQERLEGALGGDPFNMTWPVCFLTLLQISLNFSSGFLAQ